MTSKNPLLNKYHIEQEKKIAESIANQRTITYEEVLEQVNRLKSKDEQFPEGVRIVSVKYVGGYKLEITFTDGKVNTIDYEGLVLCNLEGTIPYRDLEQFKKFSITETNMAIVWDKYNMWQHLGILYNKKYCTIPPHQDKT